MIDNAEELISLDLPMGEYAIVGSGPLAVRKIRKSSDVDVIVKPGLWEKLREKYKGNLNQDPLCLIIGSVEIYPSWPNMEDKIEEMIDSAEIISGLPFVKLEYLIEWKEKMGREKDKKDLELVRKYLKKVARR